MKNIIIFGSQYGTAERYAEELGRRTDSEAVSFKQVRELSSYDVVVYVGALYAGTIHGLAKTLKLIPKEQTPKLFIVSVGITDLEDYLNTSKIQSDVNEKLSPELAKNTHFFHLRGNIHYSELKTSHKLMMKIAYYNAKKLPPEKHTAQTKAIMETYDKNVDFLDFNSLDTIVEQLAES